MHAVFTHGFLTTVCKRTQFQKDFEFTAGLPANQGLADSIGETIVTAQITIVTAQITIVTAQKTIVTAQKTLVLLCEQHHTATSMELLDERRTLENTLKSQGNQPDSYFAVA